jgi:hypothetical protein
MALSKVAAVTRLSLGWFAATSYGKQPPISRTSFLEQHLAWGRVEGSSSMAALNGVEFLGRLCLSTFGSQEEARRATSTFAVFSLLADLPIDGGDAVGEMKERQDRRRVELQRHLRLHQVCCTSDSWLLR